MRGDPFSAPLSTPPLNVFPGMRAANSVPPSCSGRATRPQERLLAVGRHWYGGTVFGSPPRGGATHAPERRNQQPSRNNGSGEMRLQTFRRGPMFRSSTGRWATAPWATGPIQTRKYSTKKPGCRLYRRPAKAEIRCQRLLCPNESMPSVPRMRSR